MGERSSVYRGWKDQCVGGGGCGGWSGEGGEGEEGKEQSGGI